MLGTVLLKVGHVPPSGTNGRLQAVPHLIQPGIPFSRVLPHTPIPLPTLPRTCMLPDPQAQWFFGC